MITTEIRRRDESYLVLQELVLQATKVKSHSHLCRGLDIDIFYTLQYFHPYRRFVEFVVERLEVERETFVSRFSAKSLRVQFFFFFGYKYIHIIFVLSSPNGEEWHPFRGGGG